MKTRILLLLALFAAFSIWGLGVAAAHGPDGGGRAVVYNSIPYQLPGNVASIDVWGRLDFGDGLDLAASDGSIGRVTMILSSWGCQSGSWASGCVSAPGATYKWPITVNIYGVEYPPGAYDTPTPTSLLGTITQTFAIPYRPSANPKCSSANQWSDHQDNTCYTGFAFPVGVDFSKQKISIPANQRIIVTAVYNSSYFGPSPVGPTCVVTGCPYDSLNISASGDGPNGLRNGVGAFLDYNGVFINLTNDANSCNGSGPGGDSADAVIGSLALNTSATSLCYSNYHPMIEVDAVPPFPTF